jgi:hypothetical protein
MEHRNEQANVREGMLNVLFRLTAKKGGDRLRLAAPLQTFALLLLLAVAQPIVHSCENRKKKV